MKNFSYFTPTKLVFGSDSIKKLPDLMRPYGKKVLLAYGKGSIKKIGLYDEVIKLLSDFEIYELKDIEPNPKYNPSVLDGVRICKENKIDMVLAVGGGSTIECCKAICGASYYDGDPWDIIIGKVGTKKAIPLFDVLTLAATGSEYDDGGVISRKETNDKVAYASELVFPIASILDPKYTYSVSKAQTIAGSIDAINHVMEQYFCKEHSLLTDGMCEATIKSIIKNVKIAINEPDNYDARSELMVCCSLACNGILSIGNSSSGWPCHGIEHALSGYYDITHGTGLAIVTPRWMKHILNDDTIDRFVSFGINIFDINPTLDKYAIANKTIEETYNLFKDLGSPMSLREVGINEERLSEMAHHIAINEGLENAWAPLNEEDILEILKNSL